MENIRYLQGEEKNRTRKLWREAFPEDSKQFLDYYYSEKMKDNRVLVKEEQGRIVSMLHRNPYKMALGGCSETIDYIVAVATAADSRHRGHMRALLERMLQDMYAERMPFTFLMPADEAIYRPFQFAYICPPREFSLNGDSSCRKISLNGDSPRLMVSEAAEYMNRWLKERYQVYCLRDEAYVERLLKELASENGQLELLYDGEENSLNGGCLRGVRAEWGLERREQRLLMTDEGLSSREEPAEHRPGIMARIAWLPGFLSYGRLREDCEEEQVKIRLTVHDPMLSENDGTFIWTLCHDGASAVRASGTEECRASAELTVDQLVQWMFSYGEGCSFKEKFPYIDTWDGVFIDEVV